MLQPAKVPNQKSGGSIARYLYFLCEGFSCEVGADRVFTRLEKVGICRVTVFIRGACHEECVQDPWTID